MDPETGVPALRRGVHGDAGAGLYLAGVIASGNDANRLFIENARGHGELIVRHLVAARRARQGGVTPAA